MLTGWSGYLSNQAEQSCVFVYMRKWEGNSEKLKACYAITSAIEHHKTKSVRRTACSDQNGLIAEEIFNKRRVQERNFSIYDENSDSW